jgi:protein-S-isoprenylcysteine O-methyltransferase Ste14
MPHRAMEKSLWSQIVAATAFFSGAAFMGQAPTGGPLALAVSESIMILSAALGIATVLSLGKSFGILIAVREVRSSGPYSLVRHPMYVTDILLRIGFTVNHFTAFTAVLLVLTSACYVYRALLEEKFLGRFPDYREYMARVRRRFIPLVF